MSNNLAYFKFGLQSQTFEFRSILDGPDKETILFEKEPWMEYVLTSTPYRIEDLLKVNQNSNPIHKLLSKYHINLKKPLKSFEDWQWDKNTYIRLLRNRRVIKKLNGNTTTFPYITYYQFIDYYSEEPLLITQLLYKINTNEAYLVSIEKDGKSGSYDKYRLGFIHERGIGE